MPSFVTHIIIAQEVLASSRDPAIEESRTYFLLWSLGHHLLYCRTVFGTSIGIFFEEKDNPDSPGYYSGTGDYSHSKTSNPFPMKKLAFKGIWHFNVRKVLMENISKGGWICGR